MNVVSDPTIFNFHPNWDWIVTQLARAEQNYEVTDVQDFEEEYILPSADHWAPVRVYWWRRHNIGEIITNENLREL